MAYADLGKKVKAKYPGQYDDLSDDAVGQKVASKYPGQYDDIVGQQPASTAPEAANPNVDPRIPQGAARNRYNSDLGGFTGFVSTANDRLFGGLARGTAGLAKLFTNDATDKKIDEFTKRGAPLIIPETTAGAIGAGVGEFGRLATESVPQLLLPGGTKAAQLGSNVLSSAVKGASASGEAGGNSKQQLASAAIAGALSGIITKGAQEIPGAIKRGLQNYAEGTYNSIFKTPTRQLAAGREPIGTGLLKRGISGSEDDIAKAVAANSEGAGQALKDILSKKGDTPVDISGVRSALVELQDQLNRTPGSNAQPVTTIIDQLDDILTKSGVAADNADELVKVYSGSTPGVARTASDLLGPGDYYSTNPEVAKEFGDQIKEATIRKGDIFKINSQEQLNKLLAEAAKRYSGDPLENLPRLISDKGYKAIEGSADAFGDEAGINVIGDISKSLGKSVARDGRNLAQAQLEDLINKGDIAGAKRLAATLPADQQASVASILDVLGDQPSGPTPTQLPLSQAQQLKTDLQAAVNNAFLNPNSQGSTQAQKLAAQKLRAAIEAAVPDVSTPNAELAFGKRALDQLERQANYSPSKLRQLVEGAALGGGVVSGNPGPLAAVLSERLLTSPKVATNLAQGAYRASQKSLNPITAALLSKALNTLVGAGVGSTNGRK